MKVHCRTHFNVTETRRGGRTGVAAEMVRHVCLPGRLRYDYGAPYQTSMDCGLDKRRQGCLDDRQTQLKTHMPYAVSGLNRYGACAVQQNAHCHCTTGLFAGVHCDSGVYHLPVVPGRQRIPRLPT